MAQRTALRVAALLGALSVAVAGCGAASNTTAPGAQGPTKWWPVGVEVREARAG